MKNIDFINIEAEYSLTRYQQHNPVFQKGQGVWLWDVESKQYFDMTCLHHHAIFGHSPARLVNVLVEQAQNLSLNTQKIPADRLGPFLKKLAAMTGFERSAACSSPYQAYSDILAYAELYARSVKTINKAQATCIVVESSPTYFSQYASLFAGVQLITPTECRSLDLLDPNIALVLVDLLDLNELELLIDAELIAHLKVLCRRNQSLLIADLTQLPPAMLGLNFAFQAYPSKIFDGMIWGEYLGAGLTPLAAISVTEDVFTQAGALSTSLSTLYPLAAAIGLESLCMIEELFLTEQAIRQSLFLKEVFEGCDFLEHVYHRGSIFKLKLRSEEELINLLDKFEAQHTLVHRCSETELLLSPPLICSEQELEVLLRSLKKIFQHQESSSVID